MQQKAQTETLAAAEARRLQEQIAEQWRAKEARQKAEMQAELAAAAAERAKALTEAEKTAQQSMLVVMLEAEKRDKAALAAVRLLPLFHLLFPCEPIYGCSLSAICSWNSSARPLLPNFVQQLQSIGWKQPLQNHTGEQFRLKLSKRSGLRQKVSLNFGGNDVSRQSVVTGQPSPSLPL